MSSILSRIQSLVQGWMGSSGSSSGDASSLGSTWQNALASQAYQAGTLRSEVGGGGEKVRVAFRNLSTMPLILCWVSGEGKLHHFYTLKPSQLGAGEAVNIQDHIENTSQGHAFCILTEMSDKEREQAKESKEILDVSKIIGGYRPSSSNGGGPKKKKKVPDVHLVEIGNQKSEFMNCCAPSTFFGLRGRKRRHGDSIDTKTGWFVRVRPAKLDPTPYDTTKKEYLEVTIGGWPCFVEKNWHGGDTSIEERLEQDLQYASKCLPPHAKDYLQEKCPIWINKTIKYGPKACPIKGKGACFHPDADWLQENGLNVKKVKCVEINDGPYYGTDVHLWGTGGLILHELSHAYHNCMIANGYKNKEIQQCFQAAMKEKLYECVKVHGPQGPEAKAYACTNEMEYFAELSAAFLGGVGEYEDKEYNKWYPFNRKQVKEHDPRAYQLLSKLWKVNIPSGKQ